MECLRKRSIVLFLLLAVKSTTARADPPAAASSAFDAYCRAVEARLGRQHAAGSGSFLARPAASLAADSDRVERVSETSALADAQLPAASGARLDHWRGTAFIPGATAAQFEALLRDVTYYPSTFAPEVERAAAQHISGDRVITRLRLRQHHVLTVVMDAEYDVTLGRRDAAHGYSLSRSTRITEVDNPGTSRERLLNTATEHGFLWRLNTYWSWEERPGGLAIQIETVSLSRAVPRGLYWLIAPYVDSIPRDSMQFTLTAAGKALGSPGFPALPQQARTLPR